MFRTASRTLRVGLVDVRAARRAALAALLAGLLACGAGLLACGGGGPPREPAAQPAQAPPPPKPAPMLKIVFRNRSPEVSQGSYEAQPVTLYRMGTCCGRMEYPPDPETGRQIHVLVAQPHAFWIDVQSGTGLYRKDPDAESAFRAPIVRPPDGASNPLSGLEFGREYEFMASHGIEGQLTEEGLERWEASVEDYTLILLAEPETHRPRELRIERGDGELFRAFTYDRYDVLEAKPEIFLPPEDVRYRRHSP